MVITINNENTDDDHGTDRAHNLHAPSCAQANLCQKQFHAHMGAGALAIGRTHEGKNRHGNLYPVDITGNGNVKDLTTDNLKYPEDHQAKNKQTGNQIEQVFHRDQPAIKSHQHAVSCVIARVRHRRNPPLK